MLDTGRTTTKNIIHYMNTALIVLIFILSVISLFFQKGFYLKPGADIFMILTSSLYLIFSVIIAASGIFYPKNPIAVSEKVKKSIFILSIFSLLINSNKLHGLSALREANSLKSIRRQWNAPVILILGIILAFMEGITALIVTGSGTLDLNYVFKSLAITPYGKILIALFIGWVLLFLSSTIWFYIDTNETLQISEDTQDEIKMPRQQDMEENERTMISCSHCGFIFNYSHLEGNCPNCGKHNKAKVITIAHRKSKSYKKKSLLVLLKSYGTIIGVFSVILIGSYFMNQINYGSGSFDPPVVSYNPPANSSNLPENSGSNTDSNNNQTDRNGSSFTAEEVQKLLDDIQADTGIKFQYHKELYSNNQTDASGEKCHKIIILTTTDDSDKVYWYQYYKYTTDSDTHKAGEIVFYAGMESSTITKSDLTSD